MADSNPFLVSSSWLAANLGNPTLAIVDASWYLPDHKRDARYEYEAAHIPGAVFFDLDAVSDHTNNLPHMLPNKRQFEETVGAMGIAVDDTIIVYDGLGLFSAARVWWTFRTFGAQKVYILDGGFPSWLEADLPVSSDVEAPQPKVFLAKLDVGKVRSKSQIWEAVQQSSAVIADARSAARFAGTAPEPRLGLRSGHMPSARSLPFGLLIENGRLKNRSDLEAMFANHQIDLTREIITTCGSGVTAAIISLALESIGHSNHALYDGSWAEWGQDGETPVLLGDGELQNAQSSSPRFLTCHVTSLEMRARPVRRVPLPIGQKVSLIKTNGMTPSFYRYLYEEVGKPHHWYLRRDLDDTQLTEIIRAKTCEIWLLSVDGCPAGFFEIEFSLTPKCAAIQYFGLLRPYQGRGLAKFMLSQAISAAWDRNPDIVAIETNTLDSPKALVLYQKAGFEPVSIRDERVKAWD